MNIIYYFIYKYILKLKKLNEIMFVYLIAVIIIDVKFKYNLILLLLFVINITELSIHNDIKLIYVHI